MDDEFFQLLRFLHVVVVAVICGDVVVDVVGAWGAVKKQKT